MIGSRRFRIGILGWSHAGGSGVIASELARLLAGRGHEVHVVADALPFRATAATTNLVFHVATAARSVPGPPSRTLALAAKLAEIGRDRRLDVLHAHYAFPHAPAAILARGMLARQSRAALVTSLHGTDVTAAAAEPVVEELTAYSMSASEAVTAVSRFLEEAAARAFPEIRAAIRVIPNFVDLRLFPRRPLAERRRFVRPGELLLVHASNFRAVKNPVDTVRVLAAVRRERPARLLLVGDGPEMPAVRAEAARLGVLDEVRLLGSRTDVPSLLACGDVFLLPSSEESFGLAALEAMACGVPAVTSNAGGLPELVEDGLSGFTVPVGDTEAMARRVLELASDEATLEEHREEALKRAQRFDAERIVPQYEALYEEVVA